MISFLKKSFQKYYIFDIFSMSLLSIICKAINFRCFPSQWWMSVVQIKFLMPLTVASQQLPLLQRPTDWRAVPLPPPIAMQHAALKPQGEQIGNNNRTHTRTYSHTHYSHLEPSYWDRVELSWAEQSSVKATASALQWLQLTVTADRPGFDGKSYRITHRCLVLYGFWIN